MALTGDRYAYELHGHHIVVVLDNWAKKFSLIVDGATVAEESRLLPHDIELRHELAHDAARHVLVARSKVQPILGLPLREVSSLEIDGATVEMQKLK